MSAAQGEDQVPNEPTVYAVILRYEAEETIYVAAESNAEARAIALGRVEGEYLGSTEPEAVKERRAKRAVRLGAEDVPGWIKQENGDLFYG